VSAGVSSSFAFPEETLVFHWHGDTFSLPPGSVWLAESEGCAHQAFALGKQVLGLQFHLEMTAAGIRRIAQACANELAPGRYVQPADIIISQAKQNEPAAAKLLGQLLTVLEQG
jgi:GMP synthase-like glutamine amidotransferase